MKKAVKWIVVVLCMTFAVFATGCTSSTSLGECIGLAESADVNPNLNYDVSAKNIVLALIFSETLVVPLVVALDEYKCPVSVKQ